MKTALLALGALVALPYACAPIYRFPPAAPFSGPRLFNPYAHSSGSWQRTNLHAHGRAWLGLTSGRSQTNADVVRKYRQLGYAVAGVSNYHQIAAHDGVDTIPAYEHGYNIGKHHQLAIGAREVDFVDFPIWQSRSHLQYIINRVAATADLVAIVHPESRNAYGRDDLQALTGYHLVEVFNGKFPHDDAWDAALSSGRAVWGIGNDDNHDLENPDRLGIAWTMVDAPSGATGDIVAALKAGRAYAVVRIDPSAGDTVFHGLTVDGNTMTVKTAGEASTFEFIGQNGVVRKTEVDVHSASYVFAADDTYIRAAIRAPRTTMYLNPVIRYDGRLPSPAAAIDQGRTTVQRVVFAVAAAAVLIVWWRRPGRRAVVLLVMAAATSPAPLFL